MLLLLTVRVSVLLFRALATTVTHVKTCVSHNQFDQTDLLACGTEIGLRLLQVNLKHFLFCAMVSIAE